MEMEPAGRTAQPDGSGPHGSAGRTARAQEQRAAGAIAAGSVPERQGASALTRCLPTARVLGGEVDTQRHGCP